MNLSTAQQMALAVLMGDLDAALPLADCLLEEHGRGGRKLVPVHKVTCSLDRVRVVAYVDHRLGTDVIVDREGFRNEVQNWLHGEHNPMALKGIDRIEVYEMPETPPLKLPNVEEVDAVAERTLFRSESERERLIREHRVAFGEDFDGQGGPYGGENG